MHLGSLFVLEISAWVFSYLKVYPGVELATNDFAVIVGLDSRGFAKLTYITSNVSEGEYRHV